MTAPQLRCVMECAFNTQAVLSKLISASMAPKAAHAFATSAGLPLLLSLAPRMHDNPSSVPLFHAEAQVLLRAAFNGAC